MIIILYSILMLRKYITSGYAKKDAIKKIVKIKQNVKRMKNRFKRNYKGTNLKEMKKYGEQKLYNSSFFDKGEIAKKLDEVQLEINNAKNIKKK